MGERLLRSQGPNANGAASMGGSLGSLGAAGVGRERKTTNIINITDITNIMVRLACAVSMKVVTWGGAEDGGSHLHGFQGFDGSALPSFLAAELNKIPLCTPA